MMATNVAEFLKRLKAAIDIHGLMEQGRPVIVALSGGADSVALLLGLNALGYECIAAHCNFHLRGEESNRDMRSVQHLCATLKIDLYVRDFDVSTRQKQTGESVEMACRSLRYEWFYDLLDRQRAQAIAVAHHRDDNIETFLLNLMRGSSIAGLTGMRWRNGYVVRPMLEFSRKEIEEFLEGQHQEWVNDSTNAENVYARNRIRNIVLPMLEKQFPGATDAILSSIRHLYDNRLLYEAAVESLKEKYVNDNTLQLGSLLKEEKDCGRIALFELLKPWGFNMSQCEDIISNSSKSGLIFESDNKVLLLDRGVLRLADAAIMKNRDEEWPVTLTRDILSPAHILISEHPITQFKPERNPNVAYFDIDMLSGSPCFALRHWRRGDKMQPYGLDGSKLLSDIFAGAKYDASAKSSAWILTCNGHIIWALGLRASSLFSLRPESRRYLRLEYRP